MGAGPAGLVLHSPASERNRLGGPERQSRAYLEHRVRAGVLEQQGTADLLVEIGVGEQLQEERLVHDGIELRFEGERHRIDFPSLTGGRRITVYGQQEVVKDLDCGPSRDRAPVAVRGE